MPVIIIDDYKFWYVLLIYTNPIYIIHLDFYLHVDV